MTCSCAPQPPSEQEDALPAVNLCYLGNGECKEWLANTKDNSDFGSVLVGGLSKLKPTL